MLNLLSLCDDTESLPGPDCMTRTEFLWLILKKSLKLRTVTGLSGNLYALQKFVVP